MSTDNVDELQVIDHTQGEGDEAVSGKSIVVHYSGWLYDEVGTDNKGSKFDSSLDRNDPFSFVLGAGMVIKGWDQGFAGMKVGGKRTLIIPADMGYGAAGAGGVIPPNATLVFEVELLEVRG
ncbi:MAG TPA: FKBP-type peptidyl-prolyl cis-trans isomerase [Candidatus Tenderia electrophaga]|uniref:Peptidyl-prolyl cis-trans isomerase n=1 Tax=Candidatus Tenderia electrophaga TaxID=1748243 RepID=A0A832N5E6_9GAMM|nr:FKBP-type peptidyl-prolyl cis-trans isomerase [Candidatus Tenderia electrophaga]